MTDPRSRWKALSAQDRIAIVGLLVAVIAAVPGFLALRSGDAEQPGSTADPTSSADRRQALQLLARYNWTGTHVMWALPGQLSPEESQLAQQPVLQSDPATQDAAIASLEALLARRGGVKIDFVSGPEGTREDTELRLVVTGQDDGPVLITGMRARVLKRQPPLSGTLFFGPPEGEGEDIQIGFDLGSSTAMARVFGVGGRLGEPYFASKHVTVARGEQVVFGIKAFADGCYCEWEIVIDTIVDGQDQAFTVRDGNRPFRTTAFAETYEAIYELDIAGGRRFIRLPPGARREYLDGRVFLSRG